VDGKLKHTLAKAAADDVLILDVLISARAVFAEGRAPRPECGRPASWRPTPRINLHDRQLRPAPTVCLRRHPWLLSRPIQWYMDGIRRDFAVWFQAFRYRSYAKLVWLSRRKNTVKLGWIAGGNVKSLRDRSDKQPSQVVLSGILWSKKNKLAANLHWARVVGYGQFSLCVIHKEGLWPSSRDINPFIASLKSHEITLMPSYIGMETADGRARHQNKKKINGWARHWMG
jgi:hypothetical protein